MMLFGIGMISPKVMIPDNRLSDLLHQVKNGWINECQYHNTFDSPSLFADHECDREIFPDRLVRTISEHNDEIWFICFSNDGRKLATAGKDKKCIIYDVDNNFKVMHRFSDHGAGVCYVAWSPDDTKIITCTREPDNSLRIWDVEVSNLWKDRRCSLCLTKIRRAIWEVISITLTRHQQQWLGYQMGRSIWSGPSTRAVLSKYSTSTKSPDICFQLLQTENVYTTWHFHLTEKGYLQWARPRCTSTTFHLGNKLASGQW